MSLEMELEETQHLVTKIESRESNDSDSGDEDTSKGGIS